MGGTFDPPHTAHIKMAECALTEFNLDKIMFMTGGNPPHKHTNTPASIRHHMLNIAIAGNEKFFSCDYEIKKESYSYTSDTLRYLKKAYPDDTFYFIIGGDSLNAFFTWHEPMEILKLASILVYPRKGYPKESDIKEFNQKYSSNVYILHADCIDISSTEIREKLINGEDVTKYISKDIYSYIKRNSLYKKHDESYEKHLERLLKPSRYIHSIGVSKTAVKMARIFGVDEEKAYIAGLLHDCAKNLTQEENEIKCKDLDVVLDEYEKNQPWLIHAKVGAELIKSEFGIDDEEISSAIRWHTLGKENMTDLEKIIYVADMTEPNRCYPEAEYLRKIAFENLDKAVLACTEATIEFNEAKGVTVHPNAYKIRDELKGANI